MYRRLIKNLCKLGIRKSDFPEAINNKTIYALIQNKRIEFRDNSANLEELLQMIDASDDAISVISELNV